MTRMIDDIYTSGFVLDKSGNKYKLNSHISRSEGDFISRLIHAHPRISQTLEVGCAYGLSSLHICSALASRSPKKHLIIDPYQESQWQGIGVENLRRAGFEFFELILEPSEYALSKLAQTQAESFDLIFLDGFHTFDHTLVDLFYANRVIKRGGYILLDDCWMPSVSKAVSYFANYPAYQLWSQSTIDFKALSPKQKLWALTRKVIPLSLAAKLIPKNLYDRFFARLKYSSMVAFKKIGEDERPWNWFKPF